jgi:hypothetical protein
MAARAVARAHEQFPAVCCVADHETFSVKTAHVAKVRNNPGQLRRSKCERLHRRAGNSCRDCGSKIVVSNDAFELACAEVYAGDLIAGRAVASGALRGENLRAVLNVGWKIFRSAVLSLGMRCRPAK